MTTEKHPCSGRVHTDWSAYGCSRNGTRFEDGEWWCHQHAPSAKAAKRADWDAKWEAKRARGEAIRAHAKTLDERAGGGVTSRYHPIGGEWDESAVVVTIETLERLLEEAGR